MSALGKKGGVKSASLLAAFVTALLAFVGMGGASAAFATGNVGPNQPAYWETLPGEQCVKFDNLTAKTFTVPAEPEGRDWSKAIVKAGSDVSTDGANEVVQPVDAGQVLSHSSGKNLSHVILCSVPEPMPTKPDDKVVYGDWTDGQASCDTRTVEQSRTKSVTTYTWDETKREWVAKTTTTTESQTRDMTADEIKVCAGDKPDDKVVKSEWVDGDKSCESKTVTQTRTVTTTPYVYDAEQGKWVLGSPVVKTETQTRDMTEAEAEACTATSDETTTTATSPECGVIVVSGHVDKSYDNVRVSVTVAGQTKTSTGNDFSIRFTDVPAGTYTPEGVFVWGDEGQADGLSFNSVTVKDCSTQHPTEIPVPTVPVIDECGPGNAHYGDVPSGNYTVVRNEDGSITLTAKDGYIFPNGQESVTLPKPVEKNTQPCPVIAPKASLSSECEIVDGAKSGFTVVNAVFDNTGSNEEVTFEVVETIDGVTNVYPIPVAAGEKATPQVFYSQEDGKKVSLAVNARDVALANLSFETATCAATVTPPPPPPTKTCPAGTKWVDLNHNGKVDSGECKTPEKPKPPVVTPPFKCPSGMTGSDKNHNGKVDKGECKAPAKHVVPGSGAPHTGGGDLIDPKDAMALGLVLMAGGGLLIRRRKLAQVS